MDAAVFEADEVGSGGGEGGRHGRSVGGCRRRLSISIRETTPHSTTHRRAGMDSDGTQPVLVRRDGAVAVVTLNQTASLNALPAGIKDRQSVVEGKRVSVRVDLGGRGFCRKKYKIKLE